MDIKPIIALAKEQLKRFMAIPALALTSYVLFVLPSVYNNTDYFADRNMMELLTMENEFMMAATVIIPVCTALSIFSYFFSGKATNAFHAFPFTKRTLFITNYCTGLVLIVVPLFIFSILLLLFPVTLSLTSDSTIWHFLTITTLFPKGVYENMVINSFPVVAGFFCRIVISYVFYYTFFTLACVLTGNRIITLLLCGALPFIPTGLFMLIEGMSRFFVFGFNGFIFTDPGIFYVLSNPLRLSQFIDHKNYFGVDISKEYEILSLWPYYLVYTLTALVLIMSTYFYVLKRKEERAGDFVVFTSLKNVLIFLLSMPGMILMGLFFTNVISDNDFSLYMWYIVGFFISWYIAQMIAEKSINVVYKLKSLPVFGVIMLGIFLIPILFIRLDITGYERNVPDANQVAGVFLNNSYYLIDGADFIEDRDIIARSVQVHKKIVSDRNQQRRRQSYNYFRYSAQSIIYQLQDGKQISRTYYLPNSYKHEAGLEDLMKSDTVILSVYPLLLEPHKLDNIQFNFNWNNYLKESSSFDDWDSYFEKIESVKEAEHIAALVEIIKKEIIITTLEEWDNEQDEWRDAMYGYRGWPVKSGERYSVIWLNGWMRTKDDFDSIRAGRRFHLRSFVNTLSWLEEHGYAQEGLQAEIERRCEVNANE